MKFWKWLEKMMRKISRRNFLLGLAADLLIMLSLGALFRVKLVIYALPLLLLITLFLLNFFIGAFSRWYDKKKSSLKDLFLGLTGLYLFVLFLGIQLPVPRPGLFLGAGFLLGVPALLDLLLKKKH